MAIEIERKFLVKNDDYKKEVYKSYRIIQGYISRDNDNTVRVRIRDNQGFITIKGMTGGNGLSRYEWEKEIPVAEAKQLMLLCGERIIDKTRHLVRAGELVYEVDEFHSKNEGLVMAEIELPSEDTIFERKSWLGEEVTGDERYYNVMMC